jgi:hypothetical protein
MARSVEFFRAAVAECFAAAQSAKDQAIKQAYLELARGWQALADEIEHLRSQMRQPKIYGGFALPQRSLDDFYELRTPQSGQRAAMPAAEHPMLGDRGDSAATRRAMSSPHRRGARRRRA